MLSTVHTHANTDDHALSEISHPGAVQTLHAPASRHPCMCFSSNPAPVVCEEGTWNPTRKAHSLIQRRSASTSAGVWDFMARIARAPRPTQLKPRLYHPTPPCLMSLCPASSLTQTHGTTPRLGTTRASSPRGCPTRLKLNEQNPVHGPRRAPTWAGALAILSQGSFSVLRPRRSPRMVVVAETDLRSQTGDGTWVSGTLRSTRPASPRPQCRDPRTTALRSRARVERSTTESSLLPPLPLEHRSHRSIAPTRASLPLEHRSHWSTAPTGATGTARAMVRRVGRPSLAAPRDGRPAFTVLMSCPPLTWRPVLRADGMVPRQTRTAPPRPRVLEPAAASQRRSLPGHEITNLTVSKAELTFTGAHNHERTVILCPTTKHECSEGPVHSYA